MADAPGHIIEIPASLGRDVDRAREGKLKKDLPVEAFMSDAALRELERRSRPEAVHAENLTAISAAEARRRRTFGGEGLPDLPQVRRVVPVPFRRPSISAGGHGKSWRHVRADQVREGDIIPDIGLVREVRTETVYKTMAEVLGQADGEFVLAAVMDGEKAGLGSGEKVAVGIALLVIGVEGRLRAFREGDDVNVFRRHES